MYTLMLLPARHVVQDQKDIRRAMEFLHECDLLKIEDVLPFFPDFVTIDHFKVQFKINLKKKNCLASTGWPQAREEYNTVDSQWVCSRTATSLSEKLCQQQARMKS
jgi:hypothetical protein